MFTSGRKQGNLNREVFEYADFKIIRNHVIRQVVRTENGRSREGSFICKLDFNHLTVRNCYRTVVRGLHTLHSYINLCSRTVEFLIRIEKLATTKNRTREVELRLYRMSSVTKSSSVLLILMFLRCYKRSLMGRVCAPQVAFGVPSRVPPSARAPASL